MSETLRSRATGAEALFLLGGLILTVVATQLDWARAGAACANTEVTRGFGESTRADPWNWLFFLGAVAAVGSVLVPPRGALALELLGAAASAASLAVLTALVTEPFEALRRGAPGSSVGVLCGFDLAVGVWVGGAAVGLLAAAAALRARTAWHPRA
ncbi:MAG: hypothetical protein KGN00_07990 [Chloroflexota bacterium]|nr:hypothetical protein [Chloroflexota bacterium]MDE3193610.1 hypothetical protein [Chloroflexota bacterium]